MRKRNNNLHIFKATKSQEGCWDALQKPDRANGAETDHGGKIYLLYIVVQNKRTSKYWETIGKLVLVNIRKYNYNL